MPARSVTLALDNILELAKGTITSIKCDWSGCSIVLNSWQSLREHQHRHCRHITKGQHECLMTRCSARYHSSKRDIYNHIDASHMTRVPVPCPISGCTETFGRHNYLVPHFEASHKRLVDVMLTLPSPLIKQSYRIFTPSLTKLPPLPKGSLPVHVYLSLPVTPSPRRWVNRVRGQSTKDDDREELQFPNLTRINSQAEHSDLIIRSRIGDPYLQLAGPQSIIATPPSDTTPPKSIGYDVFSLKVDDLFGQRIVGEPSTSKRLSSPVKRGS